MSHWTRLALPVGLGLVAAWMNWATVTAKITPQAYVKVNQDLRQGDYFAVDNLSKIELSGDLGSLPATAIPWEDRAILFGRPVPRDLKAGDIVFHRDFIPRRLEPGPGELPVQIALSGTPVIPEFIFAGDELGFYLGSEADEARLASGPDAVGEAALAGQRPASRPLEYLGPFRVLAVGTDLGTTGDVAERRASTILTIAARHRPGTTQLDDESQRLILAAEAHGQERIVAVVLHHPHDEDTAAAAASAAASERDEPVAMPLIQPLPEGGELAGADEPHGTRAP